MRNLFQLSPLAVANARVQYTVNNAVLDRDAFGVHYIRYPYDPNLITPAGVTPFWPATQAAGIARVFDPNWHGRFNSATGQWVGGTLNADGTANFTYIDEVINAFQSKGMKIVLNLNAIQYSPLNVTNGTGLNMFGHPPDSVAAQLDFANYLNLLIPHIVGKIYAYEPCNEPNGSTTSSTASGGLGWTQDHMKAMVAKYQRIAYYIIKHYDPNAIVCSSPFQGGEGQIAAAILKLDAGGIKLDGQDGVGTPTGQYVDVLAHHLYGQFANLNWDNSGVDFNGSVIARTILTEKTLLDVALASAGYNNLPVWNTEFQASGSSLFQFQGRGAAYYDRIFRQLLAGSIASGCQKHFLYAVDHSNLGWWDGGTTPQNATSATAADNFAAIVNELIGQSLSAGFVYYPNGESPLPFYHLGLPTKKLANASGLFIAQ